MFKTFTSKLFKEDKGFTLVELMVVMVIITIMTTIVLTNYRAGGRQLALDRSANKLAQDIRRAQEIAMGSREEGACPSGFGGGYGIRLSRSDAAPHYPWFWQYILFADCDNNGEYASTTDSLIQEVKFEQGVTLQKIKYWDGVQWCPVGLPGLGEPVIDIIFSPPDPERVIFTGESDFDDAIAHKLVLTTEDGRTKCVYVNKVGLIYVIDC